MSRPTKLTPEAHAAIVNAVSKGATRKDAAGAAGVDYRTFLNWMAAGETATKGIYFQFFHEVSRAESDIRIKFASTFAAAAKDGDWRAAQAYLRMRDPENWIERQEVTGKDGGPIPITYIVENRGKVTKDGDD